VVLAAERETVEGVGGGVDKKRSSQKGAVYNLSVRHTHNITILAHMQVIGCH